MNYKKSLISLAVKGVLATPVSVQKQKKDEGVMG